MADPALRYDDTGQAYAFNGVEWQPVNPETYSSNPAVNFARGAATAVAEPFAMAAQPFSGADPMGDIAGAVETSGAAGPAFYAGGAAAMALGAAPAFARGTTAHIMRGATTPGERIAAGTQGILGEARAQVDEMVEGVKAQATARGFRNPNRSAGAAQADDVQPQRIETSQVLTGAEADDMGLPITNAQRSRLDAVEGSPTDEIEEALRIDQNTGVGRRTRTQQQEWLRDEVARETEITGPVNKGTVTARLKAIGDEFDALESTAPFTGVADDFVETWVDQLGAMKQRGTSVARLEKRMSELTTREQVKTAMREAKKAADAAADAGDTAGARGLNNLRDGLRQQLVRGLDEQANERYQQLRRQYAILKGLQENENILKPGGNMNLNSFVKSVAKRHRPFGTGEDMSPLSRALRTMETLQRNEVKGSNTAYLLGAGGVGGGIAGLLGF